MDVAKLEKKIKKLSKADEVDGPRIAKLEKKLAKLKESEAAAEPSGKKRVASECDENPKKKKKDAPTHEDEVTAEVGDKELTLKGLAIIKNLYTEHPEVTSLSQQKVDAIYQERTATVEGSNIKPILEFVHTGLPDSMLHATRTFAKPSPIQSMVWPIILSGKDLIGIAATGSGKTLAFGLPMLRHITAQRDGGVVKGKGPFSVVMAPTRELACQIAAVLVEAGEKCSIRCICIYGGVPKSSQVEALRKGVEIVVGTPGRLEDLMQDGACKLSQVTYLVLDEADRMLDLGFEPHIRAICSMIRTDRHTLMFSATWPSAVQKLASAFLTSNAVKVTIGSQDLAASHTIEQVVEVIEPHARNDRLLQLLEKHHSSKKNRIIIFVLYKKEAPQVEQLLSRKGWKCASIHGDISQGQRTEAVESFKSGKVPLLIATDVAARGLDIPDVEVVINYSFPLTTEDYVHRIGRTGRAGKRGIAHTFFCPGPDKPRSGELINVLREAGQEVPEGLLAFGTTVKKKESKLYGAHFKDVDFKAKATKTTFDSDDE